MSRLKGTYKLAELRPSSVVLAAKFQQLGYDDSAVSARVYSWLAINGHLYGIQPLWIHRVLAEAKKSPLKSYQHVQDAYLQSCKNML